MAGTFDRKIWTADANNGMGNKNCSAPRSPVRLLLSHLPSSIVCLTNYPRYLPATDLNPIESIMQRVEVVDLDTYKRMATNSRNKARSDALHYSRFSYDMKSRVPKEAEVRNTPTFCVCKEPENPDRLMVCCEGCDSWFHGGAASELSFGDGDGDGDGVPLDLNRRHKTSVSPFRVRIRPAKPCVAPCLRRLRRVYKEEG